MRATLPPALLSRLSEFIAAQTGLSFPQERWGDLERGIAAAAPDFNFGDVESCAQWLLSVYPVRRTNEILASHLSVGETYFFREKQSLEALREQVLPQLLQARSRERRLRIWSAGCSTGEEAYTIAMLLDGLIPDRSTWNITILATDFNPVFLRKAVQGIYGEWSFRDVPAALRARYFTSKGDGRFEILPHIRKMVAFSYLNFADDAYPSLTNNTGAMDLIFCRNVLMYFTAQRTRQVVDNFHRALVEGGWLVVSPAEASNALFASFAPVEFLGAVLYRKTADAGQRQTAAAYPVAPLPEIVAALPEPVLAAWPAPPAAAAVAESSETPAEAKAEPEDGHATSLRMARSCANQGRLEEALMWCEQTIVADKMNPAHHYLLAAILQAQGRNDVAARSLMRVLYLDPGFVLAHFALGNLDHAQGRYPQAQRHFENVLSLLQRHAGDEILPEADGMTAGRLAEIVAVLLASLPLALA